MTNESILKHATFPANCDYHANDRESCTRLKTFLQSPLAYKHWYPDGTFFAPTPAMRLGSLVHCLVLTPMLLDEEFRIRKNMPLRSKADKIAFIDHLIEIGAVNSGEEDELASMNATDLRNIEQSVDFAWITQDEMEQGKAIAEVTKQHMPPVTDTLDKKLIHTEAAFEATIEGVEVQCKADLVDRDTNQVWDIKTTADLSRWVKGLEFGDLLFADTFYRMVIREATGTLIDPIRYIGVSTTEPYDVAIRTYPPEMFDLMEIKVRDALRKLAECKESGEWPGIEGPDVKPVEVDMKPWAIKEIEVSAMGAEDTEAYAKYLLTQVD